MLTVYAYRAHYGPSRELLINLVSRRKREREKRKKVSEGLRRFNDDCCSLVRYQHDATLINTGGAALNEITSHFYAISNIVYDMDLSR